MRRILPPLFAVLLPTFLVAQTSPTSQSRRLAFTHATVIDMTGAPPKSDMTVVVEGGSIVQVGKTRSVKVPADARIVDAAGKFLIPGLWDMHVHTLREGRPPIFFPLFIANGVTSVRDMGCSFEEFDQLKELRLKIADGTIIGPRVVAAPGPFLDGPHAFWPNRSIPVSNETEARQAVASLKQHGADFVKTYNNIPREAYFAVIYEARRQGLPVAGHVPLYVSVAEASDAGQKTMEHLGSIYGGILLACSSREAEIRRAMIEAIERPNSTAPSQLAAQRAELPALMNSYSREKASALFKRFVRNGTWQVPTLVVLRSFAYIDDPAFTNDERIKYLPRSMMSGWNAREVPIFMERTAADVANGKKLFDMQKQLVDALRRADVQLMAGSDALNPFIFPGFSLQDELALLVRAGLTPLEALQAATINPARFFGMQDKLGTVETSKLADLVLLNGNPLDDIHNTQRIQAVVVNGRYFSRVELDRMLAEVEAAASKK